MTRADPPRAVLDADVIYSRVLHELMGRAAKRLRLLDLVWSPELLAEAKRALMQRKGLTDDAAQRWVGYLPTNFPAGGTDVGEALRSTELNALTSDPKPSRSPRRHEIYGKHEATACGRRVRSAAIVIEPRELGRLRAPEKEDN